MLERLYRTLLALDYEIWYYVNTQWNNSFLDAVMPWLRNQYTWAPLYLFLLLFMTMNFGRRGWLWCLGFLLTFALADYISASIIKPAFHRTRPCNNPYLREILHLIVPRSSGYSFPSTHAANHFALGCFSALTLGRRYRWVWFAAAAWAILVSYAQVYVGVHFPMDVAAGASLGICIGMLTGNLFNYRFDLTGYRR
jgi:membrane-associated phospholipid phosphatase